MPALSLEGVLELLFVGSLFGLVVHVHLRDGVLSIFLQ